MFPKITNNVVNTTLNYLVNAGITFSTATSRYGLR